MMPVNRASFSVQERLPDGRLVFLRAIHPGDRKPLREELFLKLSPESLRNRFLGLKLDLTPGELSYFTNVDFSHHVAFVAEVDCGSHRRLVGVGRFVRGNRESDRAEMAIAVIDEFQGMGIGGLLLHRLIDCARELGVAQLEGSMSAQNTRMTKLLRKTRLPCRCSHEIGVVSMSLDL